MYIFSLIFFLIDLISKILIANINIDMPYKVINNFFYIDMVTNEGAAFSLFPGANILFIIIAIGVLMYIDKCIIKDSNHFLFISLIIGGVIGNLFDRLLYGEVLDFLSFKIGTYHFPIFNFADVFICIGVVLLIIEYFRSDRNGNKSKE